MVVAFGPSRRKCETIFDLWVKHIKQRVGAPPLPPHLQHCPEWAKVMASYLPRWLVHRVDFTGLDATPGEILDKQQSSPDKLMIVLRSSQ